MIPRIRRVLIVALCVIVVCGLVLCGPVHHALHDLSSGEHASYGGVACDGCHLSALQSAEPCLVCGPARACIVTRELAPATVPSAPPRLYRSPRGPPRAA